MAIKFSQFNLRTDSTSTMYLVGYDGNQNIHITVDNLLNDFINGTENTIAMFGPGGNNVIDSMLSQDAGATLLTVGGQLNVDAAATFDTSITVTGNSTLNGNVNLGNGSADLITQYGTLYLNSPIKDKDNAFGAADQILVSNASSELRYIDLADISVGSAEVVQVPVKNLQGSALTKGDPVYISGSVGASGRLEVKLADASNEAKMPALGLLKQDLGINGEGFAVVTGKLRNLTTSPIDGQTPLENDVIYVKANGTTGAALTLTKPTGSNLIQNMGKVGRVSTSNDGTFVVSSILRTNDIPNLTPGKIWVGSTGNTIESSSITFTEATGAVQLNEYGIGTHTGTVAKNLAVDAAGNVIETTAYTGTVTSVGTSAPLTGGTITSTGTIGITQATTATDGYLSSTDWNTFNNKQDTITNPVTGTGTANYVSKWTSSSAQGNSTIYDNGTDVGIGTIDPDYKLDVSGTGRFTGDLDVVNPVDNTKFTRINQFGIQFGRPTSRIVPDAGNHTLEIGQDSLSWGLIKCDAKEFRFRAENNETVHISKLGNVGINAIPEAENKLHVKGNVSIEGDQYGGINTGAKISFSKNDGTRVGGIGYNKTRLNTTDPQLFISGTGDVNEAGVNNVMRVNSNGNVAIKTADSDPMTSVLHVGGFVQIGNQSATLNGYLKGAMRYRELGDRSIFEMAMKTANNGVAADYQWVVIKENIW